MKTEFVVVKYGRDGWTTVEADPVNPPSAQRAKIRVIIQAKYVNIYTDILYARMIVHRDLAASKTAGYKTSSMRKKKEN